ncbi:uncharacterized protein LOC123656346 [Melitaea cinxia]|uniref:uncharacterized protein LOC123656346 n=1 Tax=Melitaea cinxia TaxID=113334 RepID=UPI001E271D54|nr:uncharacterized protein LOC123656346 [Melitaea cinxia]
MAQCNSHENLSDDEIFFGKLSLKEVKKRLLPDNHRQTIMFVFICFLRLIIMVYITLLIIRIKNRLIILLTYLRCGTETVRVSDDESVSIIETHSEPDMYSVRDTITSLDYSNASFASRASMGWDIKSADDSFLKIEEMVTELCISPNKNKKEELDNTLEVVEFILNNAPLHDNRNNKTVPNVNEKGTDEIVSKVTDSLKNCSEVKNENVKTINTANVDTINCSKSWTEESNEIVGTVNTTNIDTRVIICTQSGTEVINENVQTSNTNNVDSNSHIKIETSHETSPKTPSNLKKHIQNYKIKGISTPLTEIKQTKDVFKTPKNPIPKKNQTPSSKKTPGKTNAFQHITSPVASYIKKCPQVPLLRDVHPTKPLPGTSSIPKFIKKANGDKGKENTTLLPSIAYRSAKKTKMITIPDKEKLPQSPWAKKIASSLPKPIVITHDHREVTSVKKPVFNHQEDSFANLSLHQADVSVCTQKSAVSK